MHFWIDKRSQTLGRRRIPPSLASRGGGGRRWVVGAKPMVTPVHRFQQAENGHQAHPSSHQPTSAFPPASPPSYAASIHSYNRRHDEEGYLNIQVEVDPILHLNNPERVRISDTEPNLPVVKIRFGVWVTFIIAIAFLFTGIKLYFYQQGVGLEMIMSFLVMVLIIYLLMGCTLSMCKRTQEHRSALESSLPPPQVMRAPSQPPPPPPRVELSPPREASPPPYHIAVSLPQCITPPPSYEKAMI